MPSETTQNVRRTLEAFLSSGERSRAIALYHSFRQSNPAEALADPALRELYRRAIWAEGDVRDRSPLPVPATDLVGRSKELTELTQALSRERAVALLGFGGVGKSRLALEFAYLELAHDRRVHWIDLALATDVPSVRAEIARSLEIPAVRPRSFARDVGERSDLLVLDRCEEVAEAAAETVRDLLANTEDLAVLVTSRAFPDEFARVHVSPLPLEASNGEESDAVRFFVERALAANHRLNFRDGTLEHVRRICAALAGIPLALEIAASYVAYVDVAELAQRLSLGRLQDVTRTVAAMLQWSYEQLSRDEQTLFRRLAIYDARFTFADAEHAAGFSEIRGPLHRLASGSLLVPAASGESLMQFRLADPVRQFARSCLEEAGETRDTLARVAAALAPAAEELDRSISGGESGAIAKLGAFFSPVATVLRSAPGSGAAILSDACRIGGAVGPHLARTGYQAEMRELLVSLVRACADDAERLGDPYDKLLEAAAFLTNRLGEFELAIELNDLRIARARSSGDDGAVAYALATSTQALMQSNYAGRAREIVAELESLIPRIGGEALLARVHRALGSVALSEMRYGDAKPHFEAFLRFDPATISKAVYNFVLHDYGAALAYTGEGEAADAYFDACIENTVETDPSTAAHAMASKAFWYVEQDRFAEAQAVAQKAIALFARGINVVTQYYILEIYVGASLRGEQSEDLAFVLGFIEAARERLGFTASATDKARMDRVTAALQSRLKPASLQRMKAAGRLASLEEVLARIATLQPGQASPTSFERFAELSNREREIAQLVAAGKTNREIAEQLVVSVRTVDHHVASIFRKLNIQRREDLENR